MIIYPINGKNERMGGLFKTPKHNLLVEGEPALKRSLQYMSRFGEIAILAGENYYDSIRVDWLPESATVYKVSPTQSVIETIKQRQFVNQQIWIVDCDIVPNRINKPCGDTVYCFDNTGGPNQYSNFQLDGDKIVKCNEKGMKYQYAGAGIYYFRALEDFNAYSEGCASVSQVYANMIKDYRTVYADTKSDIFRLGTLPDIVGGFTENRLERTITKTGSTIWDESKWYECYEDKNDIPKVLSCNKNTMTMEFIDGDGEFNIFQVIELVEKYRNYRPMNILPFSYYIDRIAYHLTANPVHGWRKLLEKLSELTPHPSFSHGDLSVINIIPTKSGPKLIDPLYSEERFGSYVLDYAKLLFTLKFYKNDLGNFNLLLDTLKGRAIYDVLIASECVRVATYNKKFNFIAENLIAEL